MFKMGWIEGMKRAFLTMAFLFLSTNFLHNAYAWGTYYELEPDQPQDFASSALNAMAFTGKVMQIELHTIIETVVMNPRKFVQSPSNEASAIVGIWIPFPIGAEVQIKDLSLLDEENNQISFETGFVPNGRWDGNEFRRVFNWKKDRLHFPLDAERWVGFERIYIGLKNIDIRHAKGTEFHFNINIEVRDQEGVKSPIESFIKTYKMKKVKKWMPFLQRLMWGGGM